MMPTIVKSPAESMQAGHVAFCDYIAFTRRAATPVANKAQRLATAGGACMLTVCVLECVAVCAADPYLLSASPDAGLKYCV